MSAPADGYTLGVQSFTYREFDVPDLCSELAATDVTAIELCHEHVTPETTAATQTEVRRALGDAGLDVCGYGVVGFEAADDDEIRAVFEMVDRLGADYCSLEFPPDDDDIRDRLLSAAASFDLDLAIHNHGPDATYSTVDDVAEVLERTADPRLGACVDTGHYLRSGEEPTAALSRFGDRVHAVHLKDFVDADTEAIPGEGRLDIPGVLDSLAEEAAFSRPLVVEYEADPANPTPAVVAAGEAVRAARE